MVGRHRHFLVDNTITLLARKKVVVSLEEDRDPVLGHQLMDGGLPSGPFLREFPVAMFAPTAPFKQVGHVNAAPTRAQHMMGKDKLVPGMALFKCPFEPPVLRLPERGTPPVPVLVPLMAHLVAAAPFKSVVHKRGRVPIAIQNDKMGIAPSPGIIIPQWTNVLEMLIIACVETIGLRHGEIAATRVLGPDRDVVANIGLVKVKQRGLFVVPIDQE